MSLRQNFPTNNELADFVAKTQSKAGLEILMERDEATQFDRIFNPGLLEKRIEMMNDSTRFVYYTSADTAVKVLSNGELWFRSANVMSRS